MGKQQLVLLCQRESRILPAWPDDICLRPSSSFWEGQNGGYVQESWFPCELPESAACAVGAHHSTPERNWQMHMDGICSLPFPPLCSLLPPRSGQTFCLHPLPSSCWKLLAYVQGEALLGEGGCPAARTVGACSTS